MLIRHDREKWLLGLMSGTSMDGVDAALIRSDGVQVLEQGLRFFRPFSVVERGEIAACLGVKDRRCPAVRRLESHLTLWHVEAVEQLLTRAQLVPADVSVIGFHGQTLWHNPAAGETVQIGDGALLARETGCPVVYDFRTCDVAQGGEGAPLAPAYHAALARSAGLGAVAFLNIGGVSNLTFVRGDDELLACDLGPGNALMDDWAGQCTGDACDWGGRMAQGGTVNEVVLSAAMAHPFFAQALPKSLDRNRFSLDFFTQRLKESADIMATLAAFTVRAIAVGATRLPAPPSLWYVSGGGRHNPVLMTGLRRELSGAVLPVEAGGWDGDALEAQAFAYLALRSVLGLPLSWPETTGVPAPCQGGVLALP